MTMLGLQCVDAVTYALALVGVIAVPFGVVEVLVFGGLVFTKWLLFFLGALFAMVAGLKLRPASPKKRAAAADQGPNKGTVGDVELSRLQRWAAVLPPARWTGLTPNERFSPATKLLVGSIVMLGVSYTMEAVFGISVVS